MVVRGDISQACHEPNADDWHDLVKFGGSRLAAVLNRYSSLRQCMEMCSKSTSTKSLSFCMTTLNTSLTNRRPSFLSHDCSYYVSRPILAPPPLRFQRYTDLHAHNSAQSPDLRHQPRLVKDTCAWSWRLCGINPALRTNHIRMVLIGTFIGAQIGKIFPEVYGIYTFIVVLTSPWHSVPLIARPATGQNPD